MRDIRYLYGKPAADYFSMNTCCKKCYEDRLVLLCIHHTKGKDVDVDVDEFETLCHNCHMLEHNAKNGEETYDNYVKIVEKRKQDGIEKDSLILKMMNEGVSIRNIIKEAHTSKVSVHRIAVGNGFLIQPQKGYVKKKL